MREHHEEAEHPVRGRPERFDLVNEELVMNQAMLIEASAGTGKTYSLERLVARLIVEKAVPVQSLLIMTFTRAATAELSARIRKILMTFREDLKRISSPDDRQLQDCDDPNNRALLTKWLQEEDRQQCIDRLSEAVNRFDDAAVFTIHSFCQKMLTDYVFSRGGSFDMAIGQDDALVGQVLDEALRNTYAERRADRAFIKELRQWENWEEKLGKLKSQSMDDVDLDVLSVDEGTVVSEDMKAWVQQTFRKLPDRIRALKQVSKTLTFDDLLLELWLALRDKDSQALVDNIRHRFKAVLVDEFQDTDPVQFSIFERLFLTPHGSSGDAGQYLFFVGDPKQAIYGFRSAELETYLSAKRKITHSKVLDVNFRSTPALVHAVNTFFQQADGQGASRFLNDEIRYDPVGFNSRKLPLMRKTPSGWVPVPAFELWTNDFGKDTRFTEKQVSQWQAKAVATDIVSLLDGTVHYEGRPLEAKDIAILVKKRAGADRVVKELAARGIRTRLNSNESVFQSPEALEVLAVLDAMIAPDNLGAVTAARATRLIGHSLKDIQEDEQQLLAFRQSVKASSVRIVREGIYPVFIDLMRQYGTVSRLLPLLKGARMLANYQQVLELMQVAQQQHGDLMEMTHWLQKAVADEQAGLDEDTAKLRIESDENLVNIVTIHASKGLEYPVVYLCDAVGTRVTSRQSRSIFREDDNGRRRYLLTDRPMSVTRHAQTRRREEQELVRLAYVGMTRASARMVLPLVLGVAHQRTVSDFSKFSTDSIASAYVRALYAEPVPYSDKTGGKALSTKERLRKTFGAAVQGWRDSLEKAGEPVKGPVLSKAEEVIHIFQESFHQNKDYQQYPGIPLKQDLTAGDFYRWRHVSGPDDDREIAVNEKGLRKISSRYLADTPNEMPKTWGRTSFSSINRKLAVEKHFRKGNNGYAAFPKGTVAGDFLHKLIEKAIRQHIAVDVPTMGLRAFIEGEMKDRPFFAGNEDRRYQKVCLERLEYGDHEGPASFLEYCTRWLENCLRTLLTEPVRVPDGHIDIGGLVRNRQVVPEIDFMLTAFGIPGHALDVGRLVDGLEDLPLAADPASAADSLRGYLTGQIDLLLRNTDGKYWVIDWKSNAIETETDSCDNPANYTQEAMKTVMDEHHYQLQALCYTVALFRYLQQRHPGKTPDEVLDMIGGAVYVFVRGLGLPDQNQNQNGIYCMPIDEIRGNVRMLDSILGQDVDGR